MKTESPKGFISAPTIEQLQPTIRERALLKMLWDWQEASAKSELILGKPVNDDYLDARTRHNETMSALLTQAAYIPIDDPIVRQERRQRAIIEKALVSLSAGDAQRTRELLREL